MTSHTSLSRRLIGALAASLLLIGTAACTSAPNDSTETTTASAPTYQLTAEARDACSAVLEREIPDASKHLIIIDDSTASRATSPMPPDLAEAITDASVSDGSVSVIAVDGEGAEPALLAKYAALSTPGDRTRPSVGELANVMPSCVDQVLLSQAAPTAPGTDLHRALALASELTTATSEVWLRTDLVSTNGPFALDDDLLALEPAEAGRRIASAAPIDFDGAALHIIGIGTTNEPLLTANREWLRDLATQLCSSWNATGCEGITAAPGKAGDVPEGLPEDHLPTFPSVVSDPTAGGCTFEAPASIVFSGDSSALRDDASIAFANAIALILANPTATATIVGHTASSAAATDEEDRVLSQMRADAVLAFFVAASVDEDRLTALGVGDSQPKVEDLDENGEQIAAAAATERRVDILVEGTGCSA